MSKERTQFLLSYGSIILLAANIVFFAWYFGPRVVDDSSSYLRLSYSLLKYDTYAYHENPFGNSPLTGESISGNDTSFRAPLYPLIVYVLWKWYGSVNTWIVLVFQAAALFSAVLFFTSYLRIQMPTTGHWLSIAAALFPAIGYYSVTLIADGLFWASLLVFFVLLHRALSKNYKKDWFLSSVVLLLSIYLRPVLIAFPLILILYTVWKHRSSLRPALVFSACIFVALLPWMARNYVREGNFLFVSESTRLVSVKAHRSTLHYSLLDNVLYVKSYLFDFRRYQAFSDLYQRFDHSAIYPEYAEKYRLPEALILVGKNFPWFLLMYLSEFITLHLPEYYYFSGDIWLSLLLTFYYAAVYLGTFIFFILFIRKKTNDIDHLGALALMLVLYNILLTTTIHAEQRFVVPFIFFYLLCAGMALRSLKSLKRLSVG